MVVPIRLANAMTPTDCRPGVMVVVATRGELSTGVCPDRVTRSGDWTDVQAMSRVAAAGNTGRAVQHAGLEEMNNPVSFVRCARPPDIMRAPHAFGAPGSHRSPPRDRGG